MVTTTSAARSAKSTEQDAHEQPYQALTDAVRDLVNVMRDGGIGQLEVRQGDLRISLKSANFVEDSRAHNGPVHMMHAIEEDGNAADTKDEGHVVTSPMIGTYYSASGPNERPFVQVGERVEAGQTVAIIEAMKIMNEIVCERSGTVSEIFVKNGEPVEYGHRLMRLTD